MLLGVFFSKSPTDKRFGTVNVKNLYKVKGKVVPMLFVLN